MRICAAGIRVMLLATNSSRSTTICTAQQLSGSYLAANPIRQRASNGKGKMKLRDSKCLLLEILRAGLLHEINSKSQTLKF